MQQQDTHSDFIRFLKDENFIEWQLLQSSEMNAFWEDYLNKHPEDRTSIALAKKHFRNINLSNHSLSQRKKDKAIKKLELALRAHQRRRTIRRIAYISVACLVAVLLSILYVQHRQHNGQLVTNSDYIVGNELQSQDIRLITADKTTSFEENIDIEIDKNGTAAIKSGDITQESVVIAEDALNKLIVPYGKRSKIVLSDQTKVWLNSGSILEFPTQFSRDTREIYLRSGEMYIEVAPDKHKSFYVHTNDFNVKVYGTKFNISVYDDTPQSIVLVEGSVSVKTDEEEEFFISPNERAIYSENQSFKTQIVDVSQLVSWKNGYISFDKTPMSNVLKQVARYYNLSFNYDNDADLQQRSCTGKLLLSDNLDDVMNTIALLSNTKYVRNDKTIYIINNE